MRSRDARLLALLALVLGSLVAGCTVNGSDVDGGGGSTDAPGRDAPPRPGAIRIEPADAERTIEGSTPAVIEYRAFQTQTDGSEVEVTGTATWSTTVALGTFAGNVFTSVTDRGGLTNIRATVGRDMGTTSLLLRRDTVFVTPGTPADAPTRFGGTPDPAAAPELVYPEDGTYVPPNLGQLEFHYRTNGSTLFELSVGTRAGAVRIYFGCPESVGGGCIYTPARDVWEAIALASAGQGPITYTLRGVNDAGRLGTTAERTLIVAGEPITGGLYYWNAGGGSIDRFEFGVPGARAERFLGVAETGGGICVGCHTLSRDGRRIAVGTGIPTTTFQVFEVATRTRVFGLGMGGIGFPNQPNFSAFNPDATQLVTSGGMGLVLRSMTDGSPLSTITTYPSSMPDWSPDGNHIVHVEHRSIEGPGVNADGVIRTVDWNGTSWVPGSVLVVGGGNNYYPTYAPDGAWVVFNRSPSNSTSFASSGEGGAIAGDGQLWVVSASGGEPIRLDHADFNSDSWPKFDPTTYLDRGRNLYWFAWSSQRGFGLRYADGDRWQLWMSAFDPTAAAAGTDASFPAFRLPFQDLATGNHIAQWVTSIERQTCTDDSDCGGEFCIEGRCFEEVPLM